MSDFGRPDLVLPGNRTQFNFIEPNVPPAPEQPRPTFYQLFMAGLRHDNILGSQIANQLDMDSGIYDPNFNLWEHLRGTPQEQHLDRYIRGRAFNRNRADQVRRQIEMEEGDRQLLDTQPWYVGIPMGVLTGGILDPTILMPGGALVRTGRQGFSVLQSARSIGAAAFAQTALQEGILQQQQLTRGLDESAVNIAGGTVLGAILGGGAAHFLSPAARRAGVNILDHVTEDATIHTNSAGQPMVAGRPGQAPPPGSVQVVPDPPHAPLPETSGHEAHGTVSGFSGYEFNLRAANDVLPERPIAQEISPEALRLRAEGEGLFDATQVIPHAGDRQMFVNMYDENGYVFRSQSGYRPIARPPEWFQDLRQVIQDLSDKLGLGRVPFFVGETGNNLGSHVGWRAKERPGFIALHDGMSREGAHAVAFHELGHYISYSRLRNAPPEVRAAIEADFKAFRERILGRPVSEEELRPPIREALREQFGSPNRELEAGSPHREYLISYQEWVADNIAHWFASAKEPRTVVEKFFASLADLWRQIFEKVGEKVAPSIDRFMRGQWDNWHLPLEASDVVPMTRSADVRPGVSFMMRAENHNGPVHVEGAGAKLDEATGTVTTSGDLGAAQVTAMTTEDLSIRGTMARVLGKTMAWAIPNFRGNFRLTGPAREFYQKLFSTTALQEGHAKGLMAAPGGAAEDFARRMGALYTTTVRDLDPIYKEMLQTHKMSREEFGEAIGWANSNADTAVNQGNPFVTRAAELVRKQFWNPMLEEGKRVGVFKADATISTAESYFPRQAMKEAFVQHHDVWMQRNIPYWREVLTKAHNQDLEKLTRRLDDLDVRIADLGMTPTDRTELAQKLGEQMEQVRTQYGHFFDIETEVRELRRQIRDGGDRAALSAQITQLRETPGYKQFETFISQTGGRQRRLLMVDPANKIDQLHDRMQLEEDRIFSQTRQLIEKGRAAEKKFAKLETREEWDEAVGAYRQQIEDFLDGVDARRGEQQARLAKVEADFVAKRQKLHDEWKAKEQQLGDPALRTEAAKARDKLLQKRQQLALDYEEREIKRAHRDIARANRDDERHARMRERLARLEEADPDEAREIIQASLNDFANSAAEKLTDRGMRVQRLLDRMNELDPEWANKEVARLSAQRRSLDDRFHEKWRSGDNVGTKTPNFDELAREISQEAYDKYRGSAYGNDTSARPDYIWTIERGPMRDRTYNVPDFILDPPGDPVRFFNRNFYEVGQIHSRQMVGDIAIARVFGDPTMRDVLGEVARDGLPAVKGKLRESYDELDAAIRRSTSIDELRRVLGGSGPTLGDRVNSIIGRGSLEDAKARALTQSNKDFLDAKSDLINGRDSIRGLFQVAENSSSFGRVSRGLAQINYVRVMGQQPLAMATDVWRPAMTHGMNAYMRDGIEQLFGNMQGIRASIAELQQAYLITNQFQNRTLLTFADVNDRLARGTPLERLLEKTTQIASIWNGSRMMQDMMEALGGTITQTHILRAARDGTWGKELTRFSSLNLNQNLMERIGRHFAQHGETFKHGRGEVLVAHSENWTHQVRMPDGTMKVVPDRDAIDAFRNAVGKEVDTMFSTRSIGDVPFFAQTPLGRMLLQFNSFNMSSYSRVLMRGVQGEPARFLAALVPMTGTGMLVAYLQAASGGNERFEKFRRNIERNPGFWIAEGLDKAGIFALPFMGANYVEAAAAAGGFGRVNPIKTPIMASMGDIPPELQTSSAQRDVVSQLAGPTAGMLNAIPRAVGGIANTLQGRPQTEQQANAVKQSIPFGTYPGMKQAIQWIYGDLPRW